MSRRDKAKTRLEFDLTKDSFFKCPYCPSAFLSENEFLKHYAEELKKRLEYAEQDKAALLQRLNRISALIGMRIGYLQSRIPEETQKT